MWPDKGQQVVEKDRQGPNGEERKMVNTYAQAKTTKMQNAIFPRREGLRLQVRPQCRLLPPNGRRPGYTRLSVGRLSQGCPIFDGSHGRRRYDRADGRP